MHVVGAFVLLFAAIGTFMFVLSHRLQIRGIGWRGPVLIACGLVMLQFCLGLGTWVVKYGWPAWMDSWPIAAQWVIPEKTFLQMYMVTSHAAVGSLILAAWTVVAVRSYRLSELGDSAEYRLGSADESPRKAGWAQPTG